MGSHNKVVLKFSPKNVFWPPNTPQLNTSRTEWLQWLNLHAYGITGVLVSHIWPPFAYQMSQLTDDKVVEIIMGHLEDEFPAARNVTPESVIVTRWNEDPYSYGAYSFARPILESSSIKSHEEAIQTLREGHGREGNTCVFFAGEAITTRAPQCVYGAFLSGIHAAKTIAGRL
mmetsp:Transcript_4453/g.6760  ORF Transcript_4453/g.6760 Transcript_4453/m.6760 type:complete len:173 (-) Transcript_4453:49-567(-)